MTFVGSMLTVAQEVLEPLWAELLMFTLAALTYAITGSLKKKTNLALKKSTCNKIDESSFEDAWKPRKQLQSRFQQPRAKEEQEQPEVVYQPVLQAIRRNNAVEALALLSQLPVQAAASMPAKDASKLLLIASKSKEEVAQHFVKLSGCFDASSFELAAGEAARWRNEKICRWLFDTAKLASIPMTEKAVAYILRGHSGESASFRSMLETIMSENSGIEMTDRLCSELLSQCKDAEDAEAAKMVLQSAKVSSKEEEVVRQAKYISTCGKEGNLSEALSAFNQLKGSGAKLTTFLYNCLLDACIQCKKLESALGYFAEMKEQDLLDAVSFNTIIKGYLAVGDDKTARQILREMQERGIVANRITFNVFLSLWVQRGASHEILDLVDDMMKLRISSSNAGSSIVCLMSACIHNRQVAQALKVHDRALHHGICTYDEKAYTCMTRALTQVGAIDKAAEVVRCAYHLPGHKLAETKGKPQGVDSACIADLVLAMGYHSSASQALLKDLRHYRRVSVSQESLCNARSPKSSAKLRA